MNSCLKSVIIFIFFTINWDVSSQEILPTDNNTEDWISYAKIIESYMNKDVDPCDNFYEYACGNYKNVVPMFQGKHIQGVQEQVNYEIDDQIETLLEEEELKEKVVEESKKFGSEDWKFFSTIKNQVRDTKRFYKSCKNSGIFQLKKSEEYLNYIKNELGGWPAMDNSWTETGYDWFKVNVKINRFGTGPFLATDVLGPYYSDFYRRYFGLEKQRDFNKTNNLYQHNMKMMLKLMKMYEIPEDKAQKIADEIMVLGHQYSLNVNASKCYAFYNNSNEVQKSLSDKIDDIKQLYDVIPPALEVGFKMIWNGKLCIDNLYEFMKTADKRIVANFMALYFLYLLHKPELTSSETPKQICTRITRDLLAPIPDLMFINSNFYDSKLEWQTVEYLRYLRLAFQDSVNSREWLEQSAKEEANNKFEYIKFMVGRSSNIIDYSFIRHRFQDYNVTSISNYFGDLMKTLLFKKSKDSIQLINRDLTFVSVNVNAHYVHDGNAIQLPAGVISKPLFNKNYPHAYNFGSLGGYVIGHEMAHAIDPLGQRYDSLGTSNNWWKITDAEKFKKPVECFKQQYLDYAKKNLGNKLTGKKLNENICDSVGLRQGYRGYKKWLEEKINSTIEQIPELNMTGTQLYFLAFAHINCKYEMNDDNVIPILPGASDNNHSPTEYRVISSISNMEEFSREFNCPKGSRMNPEEKCVLW